MKRNRAPIKLVNECIIGSFPLCYYILIFKYLPERIPIHYSVAGTADRFVSKLSVEAIVVCCLGYLGLLLGVVLRKMVLALANAQETSHVKTTAKIITYNQTALTVFFSALSTYFIYIIQKNIVPDRYYIYRVAYLVLSVLLILIGNYLPKLRRNQISGVKTAYSQSDDDAWRETQRFSSRAVVIGGIAALLVCLSPGLSMKHAVVLSSVIFAGILLSIIIFSARRKWSK